MSKAYACLIVLLLSLLTACGGGSGSTTSATGLSYVPEIPAGALTEAVEISITPIIDLGFAPFQRNMLGALRMEPSGLKFSVPATLRMGAWCP